MKIFMMIVAFVLELGAVDQAELTGKWHAVTEATNNGTLIIEKEYLHLNADKTFSITLLVSVQKGEAFIKDLQIKGTGIWKVSRDTLVIVINNIEVPFAKEIYRISQASLRTLADNFKHKFQNEPIRIITIKSIDQKNINTVNEALTQTHYIRY